MINYDQEVQWLDIETGEIRTDQMMNLVGRYIHKVEEEGGSRLINLATFDKPVKVTDWKGWTDLLSLRWFTGRRGSADTLVTVTTESGKSLTGTSTMMIPVYDPTRISKGFHGETKYAHCISSLYQLEVGQTVRVLHLANEAGDSFDFDRIAEVKVFTDRDPLTYFAITRSGYMNVGDFYVFAGTPDQITVINQKFLSEKSKSCHCGSEEGCCQGEDCHCHRS